MTWRQLSTDNLFWTTIIYMAKHISKLNPFMNHISIYFAFHVMLHQHGLSGNDILDAV